MEQGSAVREAVEDFTCTVDGIGLGSKAGGVGSRLQSGQPPPRPLCVLLSPGSPSPPPHVAVAARVSTSCSCSSTWQLTRVVCASLSCNRK